MFNFREIPFFRLCLSLLIGIILANYLPHTDAYYLILFFIIALLSYYFTHFFLNRISFQLYSVYLLLMLYGFTITTISDIRLKADHFEKMWHDQATLILKVSSIPKINKNISFQASIKRISLPDTTWASCSGKIMVLIDPGEDMPGIEEGYILSLSGKLVGTRSNTNPKSFDYAKYLEKEGIYHYLYVRSEQIVISDTLPSNVIFSFILNIKKSITTIYKSHSRDFDHLSILMAMVIGEKSIISDDLYKQFSDTGSLHLLAVSGLHVGIVLFVISKLFVFLQLKKYAGEIVFSIFLILFIWAYALLTGSAPAVIRASFMITVYLVSKLLKKEVNIYNTIFFCAFFLLILDPNLAYQAGFQFSFLALISIIYFYPRFHSLIFIKNVFLNKIWSLFCVSISAQILVFPFTVFYFNSFSLYFWLAGIILVPFTGIIIFLGLALVFFEAVFPKVNLLLETLLEWILDCFQYSLEFIQSLPACSLQSLYIRPFEVIMLLSFILVISFLFRIESSKWIIACLVFMLCWNINRMLFDYHSNRQCMVQFYDISGADAIDFIWGQTAYSYTKNAKPKNLEYAAKNNRMHLNINKVFTIEDLNEGDYPGIVIQDHLVQFGRIKLFFWSNDLDSIPETKINFLVISNNEIKNIRSWIEKYRPEEIIISRSNSKSTSEKLELLSQYYNISTYHIYNEGAKCILS